MLNTNGSNWNIRFKNAYGLINDFNEIDDDSSSGTGSSYSLQKIKRSHQKTKLRLLNEFLLFKKNKIEKTQRRRQAELRKRDIQQKIRKIIKSAEEKVLEKSLTKSQRQIAEDYFNGHYEKAKSHEEIALIALLGVINASIAGGIRPIIQVNWGNMFNIPKFSQYAGDSILDQVNAVNYSRGDPIRLETEQIINAMNQASFYDKFIRLLENNGFYINHAENTITSPSYQSLELVLNPT